MRLGKETSVTHQAVLRRANGDVNTYYLVPSIYYLPFARSQVRKIVFVTAELTGPALSDWTT